MSVKEQYSIAKELYKKLRSSSSFHFLFFIKDLCIYHAGAFLCTMATGFCTFFTMFNIMLITFLDTKSTYLSTQLADPFRSLSMYAHYFCCDITITGTF